jgi:site-specific recombinase XerC
MSAFGDNFGRMTTPPEPLIEVWLGSLRLADNTIRSYRSALMALHEWAMLQEKRLVDVDEDDLNRYGLHVGQLGLSDATCHTRFGVVRLFYKWLFEGGRITRNPAARFRTGSAPKSVLTDVLAAADLRSLIGAATDDMERSILYLMLLNGLNASDISKLNISDLVQAEDGYHLRLPHGRSTPLPDILAEPLLRAVGEQKRGPLLRNRWGNRLTHNNVRHITQKIAKDANLGVDVVPQILLASMRDLLIHEPISFVSVLQALGAGANTNLKERVKIAPPAPQHVAFRLALLLRADATSTAAYLDYADTLSAHHALPAAARVTLAAAAFERHLRELAIRRCSVPADIPKTTLGFLAGRLKDDGMLSEAEFRICGTIATTRDWAAHGWFEKVTDTLADQAMANMRRIVCAHPL